MLACDGAVLVPVGDADKGVKRDVDGRPIVQMGIQAQSTTGSGNGNAYTDSDGKFQMDES